MTSRPGVPTTFQSPTVSYIQQPVHSVHQQSAPVSIQQYQQSNTITYGYPIGQPKKVIVHHQPTTNFPQGPGQKYPIMVDQYGKIILNFNEGCNEM